MCGHECRKDFFRGGGTGYFSKIFPGSQSGGICFSLLITKQTTFFGENFKFQGGQESRVHPIPAPMCVVRIYRLSVTKFSDIRDEYIVF